MNGPHRENPRIRGGETPEARLAAVARDLVERMVYSGPREKRRLPDYADFEDTMMPWVTREILLIRAEEAERYGDPERARELRSTANP